MIRDAQVDPPVTVDIGKRELGGWIGQDHRRQHAGQPALAVASQHADDAAL
jgi:hypothetical protein